MRDKNFKHTGESHADSAGTLAPAVPPAHVHPAQTIARLNAQVKSLGRDVGLVDQLRVLMAVHRATDGGDDGLELIDRWSKGSRKYLGRSVIEAKWASLKAGEINPFTAATLTEMVEASGGDSKAILAKVDAQFGCSDSESIPLPDPVPVDSNAPGNPLDRFSLKGMAEEIERQAVEAKPVLGNLALKGQTTLFYAAPNTGKTLIALSLLIDAIAQGRVTPSKVYYINVDDTSFGLSEKVSISDEYGFHMLAEGYNDFTADAFLNKVKELVQGDLAHGVTILLDTLKKFVDLMDKSKTSSFTKVIRQFVVKGGTVISLAHTNKNLGRDGKPVYGGTSDMIDDSDCAYILRTISPPDGVGEKVVEFENIKRRGNVDQQSAYSYSNARGISYSEILASVQSVDETQIVPLKLAAQIRSDAELIGAVDACIKAGVSTKMKLADAVAKRTGISKRTAIQIIEKYTGDDPTKHRWTFSVHGRGAKVFVLLANTEPVQDLEKSKP